MAVEAALFPPGVVTVVGSAKVCLNHPVQPEGWGSNSKSFASSSALTILSFSTAFNLSGRLSADGRTPGTLAREEIVATEEIAPLLGVLLFCVCVPYPHTIHIKLWLIHQASQHHFVSTELGEGIWDTRVVEEGGSQVDTKTKRFVLVFSLKLLQLKVIDNNHSIEPNKFLKVWHIVH